MNPNNMKIESTLEAHEKRMGTDREYAKWFLTNSFEPGKTFTITLECVDPMLVPQLFAACNSVEASAKDEKQPIIFLAGCKVLTIYNQDLTQKMAIMQSLAKEILKQ